jgi:hypothetical protein
MTTCRARQRYTRDLCGLPLRESEWNPPYPEHAEKPAWVHYPLPIHEALCPADATDDARELASLPTPAHVPNRHMAALYKLRREVGL